MRIKFFSILFSILPKWHVIKTKHTCRFGESGIGRTSGGWKFPELTSLGEFGKLPATRCASNPGLTEPASMFVIEPLTKLIMNLIESFIKLWWEVASPSRFQLLCRMDCRALKI